MNKLLLMSVFAGLFVFTGVTTSFARDYHDDGRKDYYAKDGKYDNNHFKGQTYNRGYKYYNYRGNDNRYYNYRKQYLKNNRYAYRHDYGNHYGHRHNHDNDYWDTLFLGFVFR